MFGLGRGRLLTIGVAVMFVAVAASFLAEAAFSEHATAADRHRRYVPGLSADGAGRPVLQRRLRVDISVRAQELGDTASGTLPVYITASADLLFPGPEGHTTTVNGTFAITDEGSGIACAWRRTLTDPYFILTVFPSDPDYVSAQIEGPEWYYDIVCPNSPTTVRSPASGSEGLPYFLQAAMLQFRTGNRVEVPLLTQTGAGCVVRKRVIEQTSFSGTARVVLTLYEPFNPAGCDLPDPAPPASLPPPVPGVQTPAYDPGGSNFGGGWGPS